MIDDPFVPKVHPLTRDVEPDDPLELMAHTAVGDPDVMLECILQEFLWMGWSEEELVGLFDHPGYPLLGELRRFFGDDEVRRRVAALVATCGRWRFRETIAEPDPEPDHGLELLQITLEPAAHP
jgi:hypothetical protein